jgi:hypothetical protein
MTSTKNVSKLRFLQNVVVEDFVVLWTMGWIVYNRLRLLCLALALALAQGLYWLYFLYSSFAAPDPLCTRSVYLTAAETFLVGYGSGYTMYTPSSLLIPAADL